MEDGLTQLTRQFLPQMTAAEKQQGPLRSLWALIDAGCSTSRQARGGKTIPTEPCPWCGSPHYVKRGETGAAVSGSLR